MFVEERRLSTTAIIKRIAAIFLLVAFFLPLSQCTITMPNAETKAIEKKTHVIYAYTAYEWPSVQSLATYAAFIWPLTFGIASLVWPSLNQKWMIGVLEMLLCVGSGFTLFGLSFLGSLQYGGYIAWGAIGIYFITTSVEFATRIRKKWSKQ